MASSLGIVQASQARMADSVVPLNAAEIHGFNTTADLDIVKLMEDATVRWLRPNEVHAILSNYMLFKIQPQPVNTPSSGTVLLFDRKMLRNFRKDGHNWRKKKDGKTVQEAHEKLKIGDGERVHVYYARNEDDPNFYRRCYWLLDRDLERIVLVHYRRTSEETTNQPLSVARKPKEAFTDTNSPLTPLDSSSACSQSDASSSLIVSEDLDSVEHHMANDGSSISPATGSLEPMTRSVGLDELEKLDWGDMIAQPVKIDLSPSRNAGSQNVANQPRDSRSEGVQGRTNTNFCNSKKQNKLHFQQVLVQTVAMKTAAEKGQCISHEVSVHCNKEIPGIFSEHAFQGQSNLEHWSYNVGDSHGIIKCGPTFHSESLVQNGSVMLPPASPTDQDFSIVDIAPTWAYMGEETKVIVIGFFKDPTKQLTASDIFCVFGSQHIRAEQVQVGVFRVMACLEEPGLLNFYITVDGQKPISKTTKFACYPRAHSPLNSTVTSSLDSAMPKFEELHVLKRLAHLLFSTTNPLLALSGKTSSNSLKAAKLFASRSSSKLESDWIKYLGKNHNGESFSSSTFELFELLLKNKLQEWILLKVVEGCRVTPRDNQGQGAIHLCAILDYAWAISLFAISGFSVDFRDARGWTALHWAAYYGRESTIATLLTAGANPSLVTDPIPEFPGGCTAADLASIQGFEGLGAYLAEKGLQAHYQAMEISGNASSSQKASLDTGAVNAHSSENFSEQELCLKDSLAAYRNAADAAARIQTAFRERSHRQQMKVAQLEQPMDEAERIIAALKIQRSYKNYNRRKVMKAAACIQGVFRTWQARKKFLDIRRQVIKIQAIFRGHRERRQYHKICWSVGVLEKAVLRWRLKRKGLRGLQTELDKPTDMEEDNCVEEDFYRVGREQAEERVQRSVVRVQAMFRSYKAQQDYRRMKFAHEEAKLEYSLMDPDNFSN